jgi:hypothetical protein
MSRTFFITFLLFGHYTIFAATPPPQGGGAVFAPTHVFVTAANAPRERTARPTDARTRFVFFILRFPLLFAPILQKADEEYKTKSTNLN